MQSASAEVNVDTMKVAELRAALKERGLDGSGLKAALQARLKEALAAEQVEETTEAAEEPKEEEPEAMDAEEPAAEAAAEEAAEPEEDVTIDVDSLEKEIKREDFTDMFKALKGQDKFLDLLADFSTNNEDFKAKMIEIVAESDVCRKLFVRNIPSSFTKEKFQKYFERYGELDDAFLVKRGAACFGFVTFKNVWVSRKVRDLLKDGVTIDGREVTVNVAQPKDDSKPKGGRGGYRGSRGGGWGGRGGGGWGPYGGGGGGYWGRGRW